MINNLIHISYEAGRRPATGPHVYAFSSTEYDQRQGGLVHDFPAQLPSSGKYSFLTILATSEHYFSNVILYTELYT